LIKVTNILCFIYNRLIVSEKKKQPEVSPAVIVN